LFGQSVGQIYGHPVKRPPRAVSSRLQSYPLEAWFRDGTRNASDMLKAAASPSDHPRAPVCEATTVWRAEERARLLDFVALNPDEQSIADIVAILEDGATPHEIRRAVALIASLNPEDMAGADALREDIRERMELARQRRVAQATRSAIGELVGNLGGDIDENAMVTLPDTVVFAQREAELTPALRAFLARACRPWFEA
jgi:hypothetical protein